MGTNDKVNIVLAENNKFNLMWVKFSSLKVIIGLKSRNCDTFIAGLLIILGGTDAHIPWQSNF